MRADRQTCRRRRPPDFVDSISICVGSLVTDDDAPNRVVMIRRFGHDVFTGDIVIEVEDVDHDSDKRSVRVIPLHETSPLPRH